MRSQAEEYPLRDVPVLGDTGDILRRFSIVRLFADPGPTKWSQQPESPLWVFPYPDVTLILEHLTVT